MLRGQLAAIDDELIDKDEKKIVAMHKADSIAVRILFNEIRMNQYLPNHL
ncbi:MAG: hypothetical protein ACLR13_02810 [Acutalibacteraceae bacterium]